MNDTQLDTLFTKSSDPPARESANAPPKASSGKWRDVWPRLLPGGLLAGFLVLIWVLFGDRLAPARELTIEPVVTLRADPGSGVTVLAPAAGSAPANPFDGTMLFQASGWIEPDPLPIKATALVSGVVESVEVLEGERVTKGQLLAKLIADDAELNLETSRSQLASLRAQAKAQESDVHIARAEMETLELKIAAADGRRAELADDLKRYQDLAPRSVPMREMSQTRLKLITQEAQVAVLSTSRKEVEARIVRFQALSSDFVARIKLAETEVARSQLALDRTSIVSPVDGIVLRLLVVPGQKRMLEMDAEDSASIAILYDPEHLQARIDVPLEEAAKLAVGQPVRLRSSLLSDRMFHGRVTRIVGEADLQRNTLQAKVRVEDPDPRLRPEMLCRAEFFAPQVAGDGEGAAAGSVSARSGRVSVYVPEAALAGRSGKEAAAWVYDPSGGRVERVPLTLGRGEREGFLPVVDGLHPGDNVVLNPPADLKSGQRVRPAGAN